MLHRTVINTALILSPFSKQKTLPPYSPILFGVNVDTVIPVNTALYAVIIEMFSILLIIYLHLNASTNQFKNIINITPTR